MAQRDYYEVLGVPRNADDRQIKVSYRKLAMKYHPDRNAGDREAEERFKEAAEAYEVLSDPQKRALYDRAGFDGLKSGGYSPFSGDLGDIFSQFGDIFSEFFGGQSPFGGFGGFGGGPRSGPRPMAGTDLHARLEVSLEEAATGTEQQVELERNTACATCNGTGAEDGELQRCPACEGRGQIVQGRGAFMVATTCRACGGDGMVPKSACPDCGGQGARLEPRKLDVRVPPGIYTGLRLRLAGEGNTGLHGGPPGDLYVLLEVAPHDTFARDGADLHSELVLGFADACLGTEATVPKLGGDTLQLEIPPGSQPGDTVRLRGEGMPKVDGSGSGDLIVHLTIEVPTKLDKDQEQAVRKLQKVLPHEPRVTAGGPGRRETKRKRRRGGGLFDRIRDAFEGD